MRVLYFIQTHRNLPQIVRLVRAIKQSSPDAVIVLSHNIEAFSISPATFGDVSDVYVLPVSGIARGDYSILHSYLAGIDWALKQEIAFDWFVNITGQCYPTQSVRHFEQILTESRYDGYMNSYDAYVDSPDNPWDQRETRHRYEYQYHWRLTTNELPTTVRKALSIPRRVINNIQPVLQIDTSYGLLFGLRGRNIPFSPSFKLYGGSYFKTLSRACVQYLNHFVHNQPDIVNHFKHVCLPEEALPQTVLLNSGLFHFCNDNRYYIEWTNARLGRPVTLSSSSFDAISKQECSFARKFDMDCDSHVLDMLDARIFS